MGFASPRADGVSEMVGGSFVLNCMLSNVGLGRARDAVDDSIGVAKEDETTAGTDDDLTIFALLAASSAEGLPLVGVGVDGDVGVLYLG